MENIFIEPAKADWNTITQRPVADMQQLEATVQQVLNNVKAKGDEAIIEYALRFDNVTLDDLMVKEEELREAIDLMDIDLQSAIQIAKENITTFHKAQIEKETVIETMPGVFCWRRSVAIEKVGLYIPGGTAPLFSTVLMLGIPAVLAGCKEIIMCTPCNGNGKVNPVILYVAQLIGIKKIYKAGGAQAIAAMAYGTATIPKVNKLFGPGNQYVTCAKQLVNREGIAIDMPAGPSEVAIYADTTCRPAFVAADLLSQAEHGADSQVILIASNKLIIDEVKQAVNTQLQVLPRKETAIAALQHSRFIVLSNVEHAFELLNEYAPEHLIIASDNATALAVKVINAGSVFLGHYSPESVGDYASGTNHTLPTNGYAKTYSGVSIDSFIKKITFQQLNKQGIVSIGNAVQQMAEAEGLQAHRNAVTIRLENL
jgi:histidinol dehydrogenase